MSAKNDFASWNGSDSVETTSGNDAMDKALGVVLVHMSQFFDVHPEFGFVMEDRGPNAYASPRNPNGFRDGTVAFGRKLMAEQLAKPNGDFSILAICAHEFGHIRQFEDSYTGRIERSLPEFCVELHADFMAGTFLAYWKRMMRPEHLLEVAATWETMGSSDFNRPGSHGTTEQRVAAVQAGFFYRDGVPDAPIREMMWAGYQHVERYK